MIQHICIKVGCGNSYQDSEPDPYYCPPCLEVKKAIAQDLDRKFPTAGQQPSGDLAAYDATARVMTRDGRTVSFGRA